MIADDYFRELHALNIRFYDTTAATQLLFDIKKGALAELKLQSAAELFERDDAAEYLEYHDEDGGYDGVNIDEFDFDVVTDWQEGPAPVQP